jgi:hypothetical protein
MGQVLHGCARATEAGLLENPSGAFDRSYNLLPQTGPARSSGILLIYKRTQRP